MNSIINQLRGVSFYLQTLIPCVSVLFENKTEAGCKITWKFSPHELFNSLSPPIAAFLLCPLGHKHDKSTLHAAELSRQLFGGCSFTVLSNTNKKSSRRHTRDSRPFAWQDFGNRWRQVEYSVKEKWRLKSSSLSLSPVQTKSWTSEPRGSKLKVWLLVNGSIESDKRKISLSYTLYSLLDFRFPDRPSNICTTLCFHGFENLMRFCKAF